jgi:hypothetical protein
MPVGWEVILGILVSKVVLYGQDNKGRDGLAEGINSLDYRYLYIVARLGQLYLTTAIRGYNYYIRKDNAYYKPSLVEVIDIVIHNAVLGLSIPYEHKLLTNDVWILVLYPLVVVFIRPTRTKLWLAFDEVICLELANRGHVTYT